MKKIITLLFSLLFSLSAFAQLEVKPDSFNIVEGFVNINHDKQKDENSMPYAVVKVKTENINDKQRQELLFNSDLRTSVECEYKVGEVWLYISYYSPYIKISHNSLGTVEFYFPYDLEPKKGYELTLVNTSNPIINGWGSLTINTNPGSGATITLNGRSLNDTTPYTNAMVPAGRYEITVSKEKFRTVTKTMDLNDGENKVVDIEMPSIYGTLNVVTQPSGATVYIDDKEYGTTPLTIDNIVMGTYELTLEKEKYRIVKRQIVVPGDNKLTVNQLLSKCPEGTITSLFSISPTERVYFSKGNLQYKASTDTWRFAEHQWDCAGTNNQNISPTYNDWIDLFGWGTGDNPTNSSKNEEDYETFNDWGENAISNGGNKAKIWRTLTKDECNYVFCQRNTASGIRYAKATVNGIKGIILLPDNWNKNYYKLKKVNDDSAFSDANKISLSTWLKKFEVNGAVFLPCAGERFGTEVRGQFNSNYPFIIEYWSATRDVKSGGSYHIEFREYRNHKSWIRMYIGSIFKHKGNSVRLVSKPVNK